MAGKCLASKRFLNCALHCPSLPCSIRLPALVALVATQIGLLSTSLSLPMLAPLLLGTGMLMRSIRTNASLVFPRIGLLVVLLWLLWFANSVIQNTVANLRKQGAIDQRMANNINSAAELTVLVGWLALASSLLFLRLTASNWRAATNCKDLLAHCLVQRQRFNRLLSPHCTPSVFLLPAGHRRRDPAVHAGRERVGASASCGRGPGHRLAGPVPQLFGRLLPDDGPALQVSSKSGQGGMFWLCQGERGCGNKGQ